MHDAARVRVVQRLGHFTCDRQGIVEGERPFTIQALPQGFTLHIRHDGKERAVGFTRVEERYDKRVPKLRNDGNLVQEPRALDLLDHPAPNYLDRHAPAVSHVAR